ncbi:MAG: Ig-like domain-containing protein, partial [Clostridia bacterium]|nr:Ig-like domain-containing protein [Clostridia bacterium]
EPDEPNPPTPEGDTLIAEEDFTKFTPNTHPETDLYIRSSDNKGGDSEDFLVKQAFSTEDPNKSINYITMGSDAGNLDSFYGYKFPENITYDVVLDLGFRVNQYASSRGLRIFGSGSNVHNLQNATSYGSKDEFGFHYIRYTFIRNTEGKYVVTRYDMLNGGKEDGSQTTTFTSLPGMYVQQWLYPQNKGTGSCVDISRFKLFKHTTPQVVSTNGGDMERGSNELTFVLSEEIVESSLTPESFTVKESASGEAIRATFSSYDAETKTVTMALGEYLPYGTRYEICLSGLKNMNGFTVKEGNSFSFTTKASSVVLSGFNFQDSTGGTLDALGAKSNVAVAMQAKSTAAEPGKLRVFLALYDESGVVRELKSKTVELTGSNQPVRVALANGIVPGEGYSVKCFAWELDGTNQRAVLPQAEVLE